MALEFGRLLSISMANHALALGVAFLVEPEPIVVGRCPHCRPRWTGVELDSETVLGLRVPDATKHHLEWHQVVTYIWARNQSEERTMNVHLSVKLI